MSEPTASERRHGCPCGSGRPYNGCCGRFHSGAQHPGTAAELMRARYCAYVTHHEGFLLVTWFPGTRPSRIRFDPDLHWTGLDIIATHRGGLRDREGTVEFEAHYEMRRKGHWEPGHLHEVSQFVMLDHWVYVDGAVGRRP